MEQNFQVKEVNDKDTIREFLMLPVRLYETEKNWIRPLDKDIEKVFDPKQNKYFRRGKCIRWILVDEKGKTAGRVAAFFDRKQLKKYDQPTGGMGFFECINDKEAAFMLFDQCKEWLKEQGLEAMDGPINFGERHQWWGLLVDGFYEPNYCMPYNFRYYRELFESYGFQLFFNQYTFRRDMSPELDEVVLRKAQKIISNPDYRFSHLEKRNFEQHIQEFRTVYNKSWVKHTGVSEMGSAQARALIKKIKPILDPKLLWFAYYKDEPVAFFLMLPELNQIFKHVNGKLNLIGKLKFLYHKQMKTCQKALGTIFGVVPEHQGKGVEAAIIVEFVENNLRDPKFQYKELEMNWIGDFNPKMIHVVKQIGGKERKTHITYRYLFDRTKEFKRERFIE